MKKMARLVLIGLVALVFVFGMGTGKSLWAAPISFTLYGINDPNLRADVVFTYTPSLGKIDIGIKNSSLPAAGDDPRFTAFAFNVPDNVTGISSFSGPSGWIDLFDKNNLNTPMPLGKFDIGAIAVQNPDNEKKNPPNNIGCGFPNNGIPVGSTFDFSFVLQGTGLGSLNEYSFLNLLSYDDPKDPEEWTQPFVGRFQRTACSHGTGCNCGSDVAVVPIPSTLLLLGSGLLGFAGLARRRKK